MFGPYRLDELLGYGGMGALYDALDTVTGRRVALRLLPRDVGTDEFRSRFRQEVGLAARLTNPHILPITRHGEIGGRLFLETPLVDGADLATILSREGPLAPERAVDVVGQIARALDAVHAAGLVHRDVKPGNVLLAGPEGGFAYLSDFGITSAVGAALTSPGAPLGTPRYMAPERFMDTTGPPSDVYALACVLYECLVGSPAFPQTGLPELMVAHLHGPPPRPSATSAALAPFDSVVARGLAKGPDDRFPSAGALAAAARGALAATRGGQPPAAGAASTQTGQVPTAPAAQPGPVSAPGPPPPVSAGGRRPGPVPPGGQFPATPPAVPPGPPVWTQQGAGSAPQRLPAPARPRRRWWPRWPRRQRSESPVRPAPFEPPPLSPPPPTGSPERRVAVAVLDSSGAVPSAPLDPALGYLLRFTIGADLFGDVVRSAPAFPVAHLRPDVPAGYWLAVAVRGEGVQIPPGPHPIFLPLAGPAWACRCRPGGPHSCRPDDRWTAIDLPFTAPARPGIAGALLSVYSGATLVQAVRLTLPVGAVGAIRPSAVVTFSLGGDLGDSVPRPRDLSVLGENAPHERHRLHVNGALPGPPIVFEFPDAAAAEGARHLRSLLFAAHLSQDGDRWVSRYGPGLATDVRTYESDLLRLAVAGSEVFVGVFGGQGAAVRERLARAARDTGRPAEIQLARAVNTRLTVPWQLVYDEPIDDTRAPVVCPSLAEFGPGTAARDVPPACPHLDAHDRGRGTLCPFGFWGLAHHLECPPATFGRALPEVTGEEVPASLTTALHPDLATGVWDEHDRVLMSLGGGAAVSDVDALRDSVLTGTDVLYFYCHGVRIVRTGSSAPKPVLDLGRGGQLSSLTLNTWSAGHPPVRWERRRPLVVLNGCHTGEVLPDVPAELVTAFVDGLGAAGVVATEVAVEAALAAKAMELFLTRLFAGSSVAAAIRAMRWALLARGNVLGLAYAPYCDARLRLPGPRPDERKS